MESSIEKRRLNKRGAPSEMSRMVLVNLETVKAAAPMDRKSEMVVLTTLDGKADQKQAANNVRS